MFTLFLSRRARSQSRSTSVAAQGKGKGPAQSEADRRKSYDQFSNKPKGVVIS
jgi:hypothetical protein